MQPMFGYWVFNGNECTITLSIDPMCKCELEKKEGEEPPGDLICKPDSSATTQSSASTLSPRMPSTAAGWRLKLSAAMGAIRDTYNYLGVDAASQDGKDRLDYPEPPPIHGLALSFFRPEWSEVWPHYSTDIRGTAPDADLAWDFEVRATARHADVQLQWSLDGIDGEALILWDIDGNQVVNMGQTNGYTYNSGEGGVRHFQVAVE